MPEMSLIFKVDTCIPNNILPPNARDHLLLILKHSGVHNQHPAVFHPGVDLASSSFPMIIIPAGIPPKGIYINNSECPVPLLFYLFLVCCELMCGGQRDPASLSASGHNRIGQSP